MLATIPPRHLGVLFFVLLFGMAAAPAAAFEVRLGTGEDGTFSHFSGRTLCRIINRQATDLSCAVVPAPGDVHNLTNLQSGSLDLALVDSHMLHAAVNKRGRFQFLDIDYDALRILLVLYDVPVTLVVRRDADVPALDQLTGKRINVGSPESKERFAADTVLGAKNWSRSDFSLVQELSSSQSQDTMAFCHGGVQATFHVGVHPDSALQQLFKLCSADLVSMNDQEIQKLIGTHPAFYEIDIAADTYPGQTRAISTWGTKAVLVASQGLDEQTVFKIIDALDSHRERLKSAHPALAAYAAADARADDVGVPLHAGAAKYFSEK